MSLKVLLIGDLRKVAPFTAALSKRYDILNAHSGKRGAALARLHNPRVVIVDAPSMNTSGERICRMLSETIDYIPVIHIHPGPRKDAHSTAQIVLFHPVSPRRLLNSVSRALNVETEEVIDLGPFCMNVSRRTLVAHGKETQLSPKQALLVELFMRRPGETIDRKQIMEKVWETDYLGDTRTLDVHIRWIRQVIEPESDRPRYLTTVRGVGYRLVVPEDERLSPRIR